MVTDVLQIVNFAEMASWMQGKNAIVQMVAVRIVSRGAEATNAPESVAIAVVMPAVLVSVITELSRLL